ncbi:SLC13 family permease [Bifidobacterium bombi]|uniref:Citrate transporter n=1 Tax=Bifidobacterium bombi DSM 19703 TaxID=1341695 RepID=A0A080N2W0_9BIFI|nr:SLC13 family permease [Bifidobacterium bombi]KFF31226.1 citrate transporter [Bifidobacterium bombi DSM 19703]
MRAVIEKVLKNDTILLVSSILAIISCFFVHPDQQYLTYIHVNTIAQLVCLMLVVCGLQRIGVFHFIGSRLLSKVGSESGLVLTLVLLTFFSSMFITNDVALVTFIPFALSVLVMADMQGSTVLVVTLMTVGANTGSMLTPIGNAHNLYMRAISNTSTVRFLQIMGPYSLVSLAMLLVVTLLVFRRKPISATLAKLDSEGLEKTVLAPVENAERPDEIRLLGYGGGNGGWRALVYVILFLVCALTVGNLLPLWLMCALVFVTFLVCDRRAFMKVDWALPLTFIMFFIFIGNMRRVPQFASLAASLVGSHPLQVAVGASQLISNVPTSILLSGFCSQWRPLIIGTNLGGLGTLIASMASLISYQQVARKYPRRKGHYLVVYTAVNVVFLAVLLGLSVLIE